MSFRKRFHLRLIKNEQNQENTYYSLAKDHCQGEFDFCQRKVLSNAVPVEERDDRFCFCTLVFIYSMFNVSHNTCYTYSPIHTHTTPFIDSAHIPI